MEAGEEGWGGDAVCFGWSEERVGCLWVLQRGEDGGGPGGGGGDRQGWFRGQRCWRLVDVELVARVGAVLGV